MNQKILSVIFAVYFFKATHHYVDDKMIKYLLHQPDNNVDID